jgi:pimeloyl-ACP methyl ester carboxylesterase
VITLLLPGMDGTGLLFDAFARHMAPRLTPQIVAFPCDVSLTYDELLQRIDVPTTPFAIVAESFSGPLGIRLANRFADRVHGLVLVASFLRPPSRLAMWMSAVAPLLFRLPPPSFALRWALLGSDAAKEEVETVRSAIGRVRPDVLAGRLRAIATVDAANDFAASSVPTLYIAGTHDRLVGTGALEQFKTIRVDVETRALPAPHLVLQRQPVEAARVVTEFLLPKFESVASASVQIGR